MYELVSKMSLKLFFLMTFSLLITEFFLMCFELERHEINSIKISITNKTIQKNC